MELTIQNAPLFAVIATVAAAAIGASGALSVALVNFYAGRAVAREVARRAYRERILARILEVADSRVLDFDAVFELIEAGAFVTAEDRLRKLVQVAGVYKRNEFFAVTLSNKRLKLAMHDFLDADGNYWRLLDTCITLKRQPSDEERTEADVLSSALFDKAVKFRVEAERFIY